MEDLTDEFFGYFPIKNERNKERLLSELTKFCEENECCDKLEIKNTILLINSLPENYLIHCFWGGGFNVDGDIILCWTKKLGELSIFHCLIKFNEILFLSNIVDTTPILKSSNRSRVLLNILPIKYIADSPILVGEFLFLVGLTYEEKDN